MHFFVYTKLWCIVILFVVVVYVGDLMIKVLTMVDIQYDFLEGGSLAVPDSNRIIPYINDMDKNQYNIIIMTQDWHPQNHISFAASHEGKQPGDTYENNGQINTLWPVHCVQNTHGAKISKELILPANTITVYKAQDPEEECYSSFCDIHKSMINKIGKSHEKAVFDFVGLATDFCVYHSVKDIVQYIMNNKLTEMVEINLFQEGCAAIFPDNIASLYAPLDINML